jgi:hypothetical protein
MVDSGTYSQIIYERELNFNLEFGTLKSATIISRPFLPTIQLISLLKDHHHFIW